MVDSSEWYNLIKYIFRVLLWDATFAIIRSQLAKVLVYQKQNSIKPILPEYKMFKTKMSENNLSTDSKVDWAKL